MKLKQFFTQNITLSSWYHKITGRKIILYFVPHQDNELLTVDIDICSATEKGKMHK